MMDRPTWYADGLGFQCTQCGNCCSGPPGAVWFSLEEEEAMAAHLGLEIEAFRQQYTRRVGRGRSLGEKVVDGGHDCIFLDRETRPGKAVCSIYPVRPLQCRTWPWWPENLTSRRAWEATKKRVPCPGMDSGKVHRYHQIRIERDRQAAEPDPPW
jgi:Fe-S-cluster containining protein